MLTGTVLRAQKELRDEMLTSFVSRKTFVFFMICPPPIFCFARPHFHVSGEQSGSPPPSRVAGPARRPGPGIWAPAGSIEAPLQAMYTSRFEELRDKQGT